MVISGKNYRKHSKNSRKFGYSLITVNFTVVFPEKFYSCIVNTIIFELTLFGHIEFFSTYDEYYTSQLFIFPVDDQKFKQPSVILIPLQIFNAHINTQPT